MTHLQNYKYSNEHNCNASVFFSTKCVCCYSHNKQTKNHKFVYNTEQLTVKKNTTLLEENKKIVTLYEKQNSEINNKLEEIVESLKNK